MAPAITMQSQVGRASEPDAILVKWCWWHSLERLCPTKLLYSHSLESLRHRLKELFEAENR